MEKLDGKSMDIVAENIAKLKEIFPDVFTEGRVDFEALEATLGEYVEGKEERYSFNWNGKAAARRIAQTPSTGTLRPAPQESKDWENTENLYIEGDNLEVLKLLQKSYHKQVKMIYIDPPYNTGKDFVYKDNFKDNIRNYMEQTGQVDTEGNKLSTNSDASGRYHSNWLNMMYPRLKLARNLLKDDGVIFISIDDNEVVNLRKLCDEIFGEDNFLAQLIWKRKAGGGDDSAHIAVEHEYVLSYVKNTLYAKLGRIKHESPSMTAKYNRTENGRRYYLERLDKTSLTYSKSMDYPIIAPDGVEIYPPHPDPLNPSTIWRWSKDKVKDNMSELEFKREKKTNEWRIYTKTWESLNGVTPRSLLTDKEHGRNRDGTQEIAKILGPKVFSNPKPLRLLKHLIKIAIPEDEGIVMDFFAGSGSTAHAIYEVNIEENKKLKMISIQIPEKIEGSNKYITISEISKDRIRKSSQNIKKEFPSFSGDLGFKVFKLDSSNIKAWDPDSEDLKTSLLESVDNIKADRTEADLLYEILLKYGLDLTLPIEELELAGKKVYVVGLGSLVICLDEAITLDTVEAIAALKEKYESDDLMRVVFRDNGFKDAEVKTNAIQILKQFGIDDVKSL